MAQLIKGSKLFYLQTYKPGHTLDPAFKKYKPYTEKKMQEIAEQIFAKQIKQVEVR